MRISRLRTHHLLLLAALVIVAPFVRGGSASSADVADRALGAGPDGLVVVERLVSSDMVVDWLEAPPADAAAWLADPAAPADHEAPADDADRDHDHAGDGAAATEPTSPVSEPFAAAEDGPTEVYASATPGQGFAALSPSARWLGAGYTIRLAGGDARVEQFRDELAAAAHAASAAGGLPVRVADGRSGSSDPSRGEITVVLGAGPCGSQAVGCGGPALTSTEIVSGRVWISPSMLGSSPAKRMNVAAHELGHALGLQHFSSSWSDGVQVMYPVLSGTSTYRAGDSAGLRFMAGGFDRPVGSISSRTYAAGQMRVTGSVASGSRVRVTVGSTSKDVVVNAGKFSADVPAGAGSHLVCAASLDAAAGYHRALGCAQVTAPGQPFGVLDVVANSFTTIRVGGWAIDPQTAAPVSVEVRRNGKLVLTASAGAARPDIAAAHARYGTAHGYALEVPAVAGKNNICVRIMGVGGGGNKDLGCKEVTHAVDPVGAFRVSASGELSATVSGWALDPNTPSAVNVTVTVDGVATPGVTTFRADREHPDVARRHPAHGPDHGFSKALALAPGAHEVCVSITNVGLGRDRALGCSRVDVSAELAGVVGALATPTSLPALPTVVGDVVGALEL